MSLNHCRASFGANPQLVGQLDNTSTIPKPSPACWTWNAFLIAFLAFLTLAGVSTETLSTNTAPVNVANISLTLIGNPFISGSLPFWAVVAFWPIRVVGAIWPPVIPYIPLFTNIVLIFSPLAAAWTISAIPIEDKSPSPW